MPMLSQAEIDALLSGAIEIDDKDGSGQVNLAELMDNPGVAPAREAEAGEKKISAYNFWSPDRFSKEQMRAVELVHEDLAERLTTSLPTFLHTNLRPRVVHTEQGRFHDFLKDLPQNCLFHMITLAPLPGQMVVTISPEVANMILEQRLGGRVESQPKKRTLTDIDQSLLRGVVEHMLNDIKGAWSKVVALEPGLEDSTTNQHWVQMMLGNDRMMLVAFELTVSNISGTMNFYIPFNTLKPISSILNPHVWITGRKEKQIDPTARQIALESLAHIRLPVRVFLGKTALKLSEVLELKIGDILPLDTQVNQSLEIEVARQILYRGQIGRLGNHLAIQIQGVARDET